MNRHKKMRAKHERAIDRLEQLVKNEKVELYRDVEYLSGQIDLMSYHTESKIINLYEIKCNDTKRGRIKARHQLAKAENFYLKHDFLRRYTKVYKYMVCPEEPNCHNLIFVVMK